MSITQRDVIEAVTGESRKNDKAVDSILKNQWGAWGFAKQDFGEEMLIPLSSKFAQGDAAAQRGLSRTGVSEGFRSKLHQAAAKGAVMGAAGVTSEYEAGKNAAVDQAVTKAGPIDRTVVEAATPIQFDPRIVDVQRSQAPITMDITQRGQAGFTASYNIISDRDEPIGYLSEGEALDLSGEKDSDHTLENRQKDMKIWVDKVNISDFTARAEASLGYMDVTQMTFGQRVIAHALMKARAYFYGDPSVGSGSNNIEDDSAYEGMAKMAVDAGNDVDKSGISMTGDTPLMTDIKKELTQLVEDTAATYNSLRVGVSPTMFDDIENEANPTVRIDSFDEAINFGGRALSIKGVPLREYPNIRNYSSLSSSNFTSSERDVFVWDTNAMQFRALMPLTTVPLARVGLGNRAAMAEFGTLIDKSHGTFLRYLSDYAA